MSPQPIAFRPVPGRALAADYATAVHIPKPPVCRHTMKAFGRQMVGGVKAVGKAQASMVGAVADAAGSAVSAVITEKGDVNSRCNTMVKEAAGFNESLSRTAKDLQGLVAAAEVLLVGARAVLESPLPSVYEAPGAPQPAGTAGGTGFSGQALNNVKVELSQKLQSEVFQPLAQWQASFKDAEARQKALNKLFAEQESQKKRVESQKAKVAELQAKKATDAKAAEKYDEAVKALAQQESALTVAVNRHTQEEAQQFAKLSPLVQQATQLRGWLKAALAVVAATFNAASEALPQADVDIQRLSLK